MSKTKIEFNLNKDNGFFWNVEILEDINSQYQNIKVIQHDFFGKALLLDNHIMFSEYDEHIYHEMAAYPNLMVLKKLDNALIIGGGDCLLAKRILETNVKKIDQVEIDKKVVDISQKYFSGILGNTLNDKRLNIHYEDALKFEFKNKYDFILLDLTDPQEDNQLSNQLFNRDYYLKCKNYLVNSGIMTVQIGCPYLFKEHFEQQTIELQSIFKHVFVYGKFMHCFGMHQYFISCSDTISFSDNQIKKAKHFIFDFEVQARM
jgi:spermidine synthase